MASRRAWTKAGSAGFSGSLGGGGAAGLAAAGVAPAGLGAAGAAAAAPVPPTGADTSVPEGFGPEGAAAAGVAAAGVAPAGVAAAAGATPPVAAARRALYTPARSAGGSFLSSSSLIVIGSYSGTSGFDVLALPGAPASVTGVDLALGDLLLQLDDRVQQRVGTWRAARHVDVHGQEVVHARHRRIRALVRPAGGRAHAHRDHVFGIGHLVIDAADRVRHFDRDRSRNDHDVGLARRRTVDL